MFAALFGSKLRGKKNDDAASASTGSPGARMTRKPSRTRVVMPVTKEVEAAHKKGSETATGARHETVNALVSRMQQNRSDMLKKLTVMCAL